MKARVLPCLLLAGLLGGAVAQELSRNGPSWDFSHGELRVSENRRFLVNADGTPFFYLSDTNWDLFHRARREDAERLIEKRRQQGFTVDLRKIAPDTVVASWFDPKTGEADRIGEFPSRAVRQFDPPGDPRRGNDWVLVLDDKATGFTPPGAD